MPKFFQYETAAHAGHKDRFKNIEFKKNDFENSLGSRRGTLLEIIPVHIKRPPVIQFIAYIDSLSDNFSPTYTEEQPFGRVDPYYVWKSSNRKINITWSVPSSSKSSALDNLNNLSWFLASLYPAYKRSEIANSIAASPLFRVRYATLISSPTQGGQGLLCNIQGVTVNHSFEHGFIDISPDSMGSLSSNLEGRILQEAGFLSTMSEGETIQVPKLIKLSCNLNVVHDFSLGWDASTGQWRGGRQAPKYPYGLGLQRDAKDNPSVGIGPADDAQVGVTPKPDRVSALPGDPQHRATSATAKKLNAASVGGKTGNINIISPSDGDTTVKLP